MSRLHKAAFGIGWGSLAVILLSVCQFGSMAIFARLLEPEHFGLIAIANIGLRFLSYFSQLGVGPAIVQKQDLDANDVGAAIFVSISVSSACAFLAVVGAPLVEGFFEVQGLGLVMRVLAMNFILAGISVVPLGLLRRALRFRDIALIEVSSYVLGYGVVGLLFAYFGAGVWALVAATTGQSLISACLSVTATRTELSLRHVSDRRRHFFSFGGQYSLIGFVEFLSANLDAMIVGKLLGQSAAGFYNRATLLANLPVQQPVNVLTRTLFPIFSSASGRRELISAGYQVAVLCVGAFAFCVGFGVSVAAEDIVRCVLGDKWLEVAQPLRILAIAVGPIFVSHVAGITMDSMGMLRLKLLIQSFSLFFLVLLMLPAIKYGVTGVATALLINEVVRMVVMTFAMTRSTQADWPQMTLIAAVVAMFALVPSAAMLVMFSRFSPDLSPSGRLSALMLIGLIATLVVSALVRRQLARVRAVRMLVERMPRLAKVVPA